jgi:hypothetical protein
MLERLNTSLKPLEITFTNPFDMQEHVEQLENSLRNHLKIHFRKLHGVKPRERSIPPWSPVQAALPTPQVPAPLPAEPLPMAMGREVTPGEPTTRRLWNPKMVDFNMKNGCLNMLKP